MFQNYHKNIWKADLQAQKTGAVVGRHMQESTSKIVGAISEGNMQIEQAVSQQTNVMSGALGQLNASFNWAMNDVLMTMGHMNDSLKVLTDLSSNPEQTWAYEQFSIARDAFRKGLHHDALSYVQRAIRGHGDHTGYRLDFRFHMLLGGIYLGNATYPDSDLIDLEKAEAAFLDAAKYAIADYPSDAARAFLSAGWAATFLGSEKIDDAQQHVDTALSLDRRSPFFGLESCGYQRVTA